MPHAPLNKKKCWTQWIIGCLAALVLASCSVVPKFPAKGVIHGEVIDTTVDSEVARYYLERYLSGKKANPDWDARIDALTRRFDSSLPSRDDLVSMSGEFSVDFAALFFADRLLARECNREINRRFAAHLANPPLRRGNLAKYVVLFVPGWDYEVNGHVTGADFKVPRRLATEFGLENQLVALPPTGSVEENAAVLAQVVSRQAAKGKRILIAGASSAGPAIHLALGELLSKEDRRAVSAWLNLGGILQGSPLIDWVQRWPQTWGLDLVAWSKGWHRDAILSMGTGPSRARFQRLTIDTNILVINYLGIPLSGRLSQFASDKYSLLRSDGPNDGLTLLSDALAPNSFTLVALGWDHFFAEDPRINDKTVAMMALILDLLENGQITGCQR